MISHDAFYTRYYIDPEVSTVSTWVPEVGIV